MLLSNNFYYKVGRRNYLLFVQLASAAWLEWPNDVVFVGMHSGGFV